MLLTSYQVLTTGFWPSYKMLDLSFPSELAKCMEVYNTYYDTRTSHRQLKWVHSLGNASIKANLKKAYDLHVTTLQAVALLSFNGSDEFVTFPEFHQKLGVDEEIAKRVAHSLSCGKFKVSV